MDQATDAHERVASGLMRAIGLSKSAGFAAGKKLWCHAETCAKRLVKQGSVVEHRGWPPRSSPLSLRDLAWLFAMGGPRVAAPLSRMVAPTP